ncbi:LysR family transcriptional regulator [Lactonifactor sp. BIOML-A3]|uniref:LysR family transcriptional regulator n=1 Tax=unclassified Lactonifactor TaxID=2636670 RepID=UPI0012AFE80D|nr:MULTISPECIES: LysR family transcriptional regulator [unclassified Lactonifactor]MSA01566.1 LysR family transcriptional regulator [Lactonifactor sp. BIOML-A5]MSA07878.1 LysR family transcriptional regulator [Lactonifactor sp. BIOML-A4]MSA12495.1 LysR family transcriptional regulator [Lactonifactor sp. BIOML-A3]MSA17456.1 LysR family transcriptional regulator [Lactonifactor sp. BIOML-A2]MSA38069.1 LysR family transcriptional regulator [Lactonifactor sp. BIOML-A1]
MYNHMLNTFIAVADCGSFTKASERLYISPTAVMKQMNALESHLDLKLIKRTTSGVRLTAAGILIYQDAKFIIDYSGKSIAGARAAMHLNDTTFCIGTSLLNPAKPFMDLWYRVNQDFSEYKLHLVPFEDNHEGILAEIEQLGKKFDFLIGVCDSREWLRRCNFLSLGRYKKMIAVSREHRLSGKKSIVVEDLYGETLMMVRQGDSGVNDFLRNDLEKHHPQIHIEDTPLFYDLSVFNRCAETGNVLLTLECWQEVHPSLVSIPVDWDYSIPYGLLYSLDAPKDVLKFVETVRKII